MSRREAKARARAKYERWREVLHIVQEVFRLDDERKARASQTHPNWDSEPPR